MAWAYCSCSTMMLQEKRDKEKRKGKINIPLKLTAYVANYYAAAVSVSLTSCVDWDFSPEVKDLSTGFKALACRQTHVCNL